MGMIGRIWGELLLLLLRMEEDQARPSWRPTVRF